MCQLATLGQDPLDLLMLLSVWVQLFFMLGSKIEASRTPRNDIKIVSVIEMIHLDGARGAFVLLRAKKGLTS